MNLPDQPGYISSIDRLRQFLADVPLTSLSFLDRLESELAQCADPDLARTAFERLTRSVIDRNGFCKTLSDFPPIIARLVRLFVSSSTLTEILIRDFQYLYLLLAPERDAKPLDENQLRRTTRRIVEHPTFTATGKLNALRTLKERELLKIGIHDYLLNVPIELTLRSISRLADAAISTVSELMMADLIKRFGTSSSSHAVIAVGKLGGFELNYSSDVDLIFVYEKEGSLGNLTHHEIFCRHAAAVLKSLSEASPGGMLYRTDARLRPDGDSGPLARCVQAYHHYYESRGRTWERQMLIKARPVAGDISFGKHFLDSLTPFVYPRTFFQSPLSEISKMKWRIEEQKDTSDRLNIKICPGGIRDIEFIVQALQLLNGGNTASLRTGNTLDGLLRLNAAGHLNSTEVSTLAEAYKWYRQIEHGLQIQAFSQTHNLSGSDRETNRLAFLLNITADEFRQVTARHLADVRVLYQSVFGSMETTEFDFLADKHDARAERGLSRRGFESPRDSYRVLRQLALGRFPKMNSRSDLAAFESLLPGLLDIVSRRPNPDHTIINLERILSAYPLPEMIFKQMHQQADFCEALVLLASLAPEITHLLCERPSYIDYLISHLSDWRQMETKAFRRSDHQSLGVFKQVETIRLILQSEWELLSLTQLHEAVTNLTMAIVGECWNDIFDPTDPVALIGMGKLGASELGLKSDLDIVFICSNGVDVSTLVDKCHRFLDVVSATTPGGKLFEMDTRLRPDGEKSPLLITIDSYRNYYSTRSMLWERQAQLRARAVLGAEPLKEHVDGMIKEIVSNRPLPVDWRAQIAEMRRRQIAEKAGKPADASLELKYSRGGLTDLEYAAQAVQFLRLQRGEPITISHSFEFLVNEAVYDRLIDKQLALAAVEAYQFYRRIEHYLFVALGRRAPRLPSDEKQLALLAKFCKFETKEAFVRHLLECRKHSERLFNSVIS